MSGPAEYRIHLDGVLSRALEYEGSGPPILLLHGFSDSADTWRPVLERLRGTGRHLVAIDLPGFGAADRLHPRRPVLPQLDRAVAAALRRFPDGSRPVVAGNSLGGLAALRAAQDHELGIGAVIPIAPAGLTFSRWVQMIEQAPQVQAVLTSRLMLTPLPFVRPAVRYLVGQAYRNLAFSAPSAADPEVVSRFARNIGDRADVVRMLRVARRALPELDDPYELSRISCDVFVIWGREDRLVPPIGAHAIAAALPDARIRIIEGCGHCPQVELPDLVAGVIDEAAGRVGRGGRATNRQAAMKRDGAA